MSKYFYNVTDEWAKQLASNIWPRIDFAQLKTLRVNDHSTYRIPIIESIIPKWMDHVEPDHLFEFEEIEINPVLDSINREVTRLGYGPRTNVLLIGATRNA